MTAPSSGKEWLSLTEDEEGSEVAGLFYHALVENTAGMPEEDAKAYLASVLDGAFETEQLFGRITPTEQHQQQLTTTQYHPDRAVREASLAQKALWKNAEGEVSYLASNDFSVIYLGTEGHPLEVKEALHSIRKLSESTVLTARIILGLWNSRRLNKHMSKDGNVAILLDEILQWQGAQKHSRQAHPNGAKRYTDGYRTEQKKRVIEDLRLLAACHVRGTCELVVGGKATQLEIDGPYIRYDTVSRRTPRGEKVVLGFLISPGGWVGTYEQHQNESFAQIDRQIFTLNPQNDRYALRLALYLAELWREQAKQGNFSQPIAMIDLLNNSMIDADTHHLSDIVPRIEIALERLKAMNIIGHIQCLDPVDKQQARWGKEWLAARWEILPPVTLIQAYQPLLPRKRGRPRKKTQQP